MGADFPNAIKVLPLFDTCWLLLLNVTSMTTLLTPHLFSHQAIPGVTLLHVTSMMKEFLLDFILFFEFLGLHAALRR